jgi:hypothetical protein
MSVPPARVKIYVDCTSVYHCTRVLASTCIPPFPCCLVQAQRRHPKRQSTPRERPPARVYSLRGGPRRRGWSSHIYLSLCPRGVVPGIPSAIDPRHARFPAPAPGLPHPGRPPTWFIPGSLRAVLPPRPMSVPRDETIERKTQRPRVSKAVFDQLSPLVVVVVVVDRRQDPRWLLARLHLQPSFLYQGKS